MKLVEEYRGFQIYDNGWFLSVEIMIKEYHRSIHQANFLNVPDCHKYIDGRLS